MTFRRPKSALPIALCIFVSSAFTFPIEVTCQQPTAAPAAQGVTEELIAEIDPVTGFKFCSADLRRIAWAASRGKKWVVMLDGQAGPEFDNVAFPSFSPDGKQFAYAAARDKKWRIVVDGQEGPEFANVGRPIFSPDGKRLAYAALAVNGKKWVLQVDGKQVGPEVDGVWQPVFSADGQHVLFVGVINKAWTIFLDGKPGPGGFTTVAGLSFNRDGRRFAFTGARMKGKLMGTVVIDGIEGPISEGRAPKQRPTGLGGLVAEASIGDRPFFEGGTFILDYTPQSVMEISPRGAGVSAPVFSPSGDRLAYALRRGGSDEVVVVNAEAGLRFEAIWTLPAFSPDGRRLAYIAWERNTIVEVVDGKKVREVPARRDENFAERVTFSPDGSRLAYIIGHGGWRFSFRATTQARRRVIVDGQEGKEYDANSLSRPVFSPDGRHLAYEVHGITKGKSAVVMNGQEGKLYDDVFAGSLRFTEQGILEYVAREGRKLLRVRQLSP